MHFLSLSFVAVGLIVVSANVSFHPTQEWSDFKRIYGKQYETLDEEQTRFKIFLTNKAKVQEHNRLADQGQHTFNLNLNKYADQTHEEFLAQMNLDNPALTIRNKDKSGHMVREEASRTNDEPPAPDAINWHDLGCALAPANTEDFPCAWPFVSVGALEGQWCANHKVFIKLSEQNLLDCAANCSVGTPDDAYQYCVNNGGVDTNESYPFTGHTDDTCEYKGADKGVLCNGVVDVPSKNETSLQQAVGKNGPVSVSIDASQPSFQLYNSGVYVDDACSSENLNLLLLVVGYNVTEDGQEYWTARNHWGTSWGENGFIRMARNRNNMCGIATAASYPRTAFCSLTDSGLKCQ